MNDLQDFLKRMQAAGSDEERAWLTTEYLLQSLPFDLRQMAWAAAVPHWFDAEILAALRPELKEQAETLYIQLQSLPFVEPFQGRGHNVHELTRRLMLGQLWQECRDEYVELSQRAADYFAPHTLSSQSLAELLQKLKPGSPEEQRAEVLKTFPDQAETSLKADPRLQIEHIYHLLIADPERGAAQVRQRGLEWHDEMDYTYVNLIALSRAVREHAEAGRVAGEGKDWGLYWEAVAATAQYEYSTAIKVYSILLNSSATELKARAFWRLGDVHVQLSELPQARGRYEEALGLYRAIGAKLGEANCIQSLGDVHVRLSELPQARGRYEEALGLYRAIGDKLGEANCIQSLGDVHVRLSELPQARGRYEEALGLYRAIGAKLGEANCIQSLGDVHFQLAEYPQARGRYEEALGLFRAIGAKLGEANCILRLGDVHVRLSELPQARGRYEEALGLFRAIGDKLGEANCIQSLGDVHFQLAEYPQALGRYEEALPLCRAIGAKLGEANCIRSLGDVHVQLAEYPQARGCYEEALGLYRAIGENLGEANCIKSLGELATEEKDYEQAIAHLEDAIMRYRALGMPANEAGVLNSIANIYDKQKDHWKAIETYTRALDIFPTQAGYILRNRAYQYIKLKEIDLAENDLDRAAQLQPDNAYLFLRRAQLANLRGEHEQALAHCAAALERYPRMNHAHFERGIAYLHLGEQGQAIEAYRQGLEVTDAPSDLDDALDELQTMQNEAEAPTGVAEAIQLLQDWIAAFHKARKTE